jgi:hypothetical protein
MSSLTTDTHIAGAVEIVRASSVLKFRPDQDTIFTNYKRVDIGIHLIVNLRMAPTQLPIHLDLSIGNVRQNVIMMQIVLDTFIRQTHVY